MYGAYKHVGPPWSVSADLYGVHIHTIHAIHQAVISYIKPYIKAEAPVRGEWLRPESLLRQNEVAENRGDSLQIPSDSLRFFLHFTCRGATAERF